MCMILIPTSYEERVNRIAKRDAVAKREETNFREQIPPGFYFTLIFWSDQGPAWIVQNTCFSCDGAGSNIIPFSERDKDKKIRPEPKISGGSRSHKNKILLGIKIPKGQPVLVDIEPGRLRQQGEAGSFNVPGLLGLLGPGAGVLFDFGKVGDGNRLSQSRVAPRITPAPIRITTHLPIFAEFQGDINQGTDHDHGLITPVIGDQVP